MNLETILAVIGSGAISGGAVGLIAKRWMEHVFNVRMSEIEARNRILAQEHQVRFTRYDEKVAFAIEGAYALVCEYSEAINEAIRVTYESGFDGATDALALPDGVADKFMKFVRLHSIYLPENITEKLVSVRFGLRDAYMEELGKLKVADEKDGGIKGLSFLHRVYVTHGMKQNTEKIMVDLQGLAREHLSRFTLSN